MSDDNPIPISALQHYSYCPRQYALIHLEQEFDENVHTMRGNAVHELVDEEGYTVKNGTRIVRSLPLYSEKYNLVGKADVVEFDQFGNVYPVEYKHGSRKEKIHDDLQLAAQAMCLEDMLNKAVPKGAIYYHSSKHRREVLISDKLRGAVLEAIEAIQKLRLSGITPKPVNDKRCRDCSLIEICQPAVIENSTRYHKLYQELFSVD